MSKRKPTPASPVKTSVKPAAKAATAKPTSAAKKAAPAPKKSGAKPKAAAKASPAKSAKADTNRSKAKPAVKKAAAPAPAKKTQPAKAPTRVTPKAKTGAKKPASKPATSAKKAAPKPPAKPQSKSSVSGKKTAAPSAKTAKPTKAPSAPVTQAKTKGAKASPSSKTPVKTAPVKRTPAKAQPRQPAKAAPSAKTPAAKPATPAPAKSKVTATAPSTKAPAKAPPKTPAAKPLPAPTPAPVLESPAEEVPAAVEQAPSIRFTSSIPALPPGPAANGALYYDSHMHTPLCKHAWGEPEEYAAQGIQAGLKGIIFTCHCPMPDGFWPTVRMADSEFDTYLAMVERAAVAFQGRLDIRLGLESEFFPGMEGWIEKLHQRADFDYILGAVHWQARDYLAKFETGTIEAFRKTYFNHLAQSAETGLYDCLAHPDLVKNYHPDSWCFAIGKGHIAAALDRIAATGVALELNTSGLNKSYSEMNPGLEMLRMMADRGIPVVVGSDAHRANRVGEHFMTALSHLQEAGYENVSYFLKRQRIDLKIASVLAATKKAADSQVV